MQRTNYDETELRRKIDALQDFIGQVHHFRIPQEVVELTFELCGRLFRLGDFEHPDLHFDGNSIILQWNDGKIHLQISQNRIIFTRKRFILENRIIYNMPNDLDNLVIKLYLLIKI